MALLTLLILLQATAALPAPRTAVIGETGIITVTATRIEDLADAASRCKLGGCPVREDIAVSVAYGSALFDAGNYLDAKRLLAAAVARTRHAARAEPLAVSQLYSAQAALSMHEGDQETLRRATWASRNALVETPGAPVLARLTAEFRVADFQLRNRDRVGAEARFGAIAAEAVATGHGALADVATLRRALTLEALGRRRESGALLETLAARSDAGSAEVRAAALAMAARIASARGRDSTAQAIFGRIAASAVGAEPILVSAPPFPVPGAPAPGMIGTLVGQDTGPQSSSFIGLRWVDIGFRIRPDGSVGDVAILRGSKRNGWAQPLLGYVAGRRYSVTAPAATDAAGHQRVERYTYTADYITPKGSLIRRRGANPRFEMMEMASNPTG